MIRHRETINSTLVVSDVRDHEKKAVAPYTAGVLQKIVDTMPTVSKAKVWTDGP